LAVARPQPPIPFEPPMAAEWARAGRPLVILDGIANPHNLGAIARSAAFFGVERLLLSDRPEQASPSAASYRVAAGGLDCVTLYRASLPEALRHLRPHFRLLATAPERGEPLRTIAGRPTVLIFGNEETGLDPATLALCDAVVTIPGGGRVQSLNVAAVAAVLIYALTRG